MWLNQPVQRGSFKPLSSITQSRCDYDGKNQSTGVKDKVILSLTESYRLKNFIKNNYVLSTDIKDLYTLLNYTNILNILV